MCYGASFPYRSGPDAIKLLSKDMKLYVYPRKDALPDCFLLSLMLTSQETYGPLFQNIPSAPFKKLVSFVENVTEADYIFVPHTHSTLESKHQGYLKEIEQFSLEHDTPAILFAYGDRHGDIALKNAIILRTTKYRRTLHEKNEIIVPPFVEDLGAQYGYESIQKTATPVVGFSGMTRMPTRFTQAKFIIKLTGATVLETLGIRDVSERQGLYFRKQAIDVLSATAVCQLDTNQRKSYSAAEKTIEGNPETIRKEFIDNIKRSHLPLVVRGHGNYSLRFFEVLSLGRVPLFIDTDTPLPLENEIPYDKFMLRVNHTNIHKLPEIISEFWHRTSDDEFRHMQELAREVFATKLRADQFYKLLFERL